MATDMAANSDSTLTNSHGASAPDFTSAARPSTMCVCGEMGYAQMTSGRHSATASATARDPSICLSMKWLLAYGGSRFGRGDVAVGKLADEALADRGGHGVDRDHTREGGEATKQ